MKIVTTILATSVIILGLVLYCGDTKADTPGDYIPSLITAAGPGGSPHIRAFSGEGDAETEPDKLFAYATTFRQGAHVATGDIDNDDFDEIITAPRAGGGPQIRAFEKNGTNRSIDIWPFSANSRTGINVAAGDVDGDGKAEIGVVPEGDDQAHIKIYRYNTAREVVGEWTAFGPVECGASIDMADIDADGKAEIIVGAGYGGGPQVQIYESNGELKHQFFAFDPGYKGGIDVAAGDLNGNGSVDEVVVTKQTGTADLKIIKLDSEYTTLGSWRAYGNYPVGAFVDIHDINSDGREEIITGAGPGGGPQVMVYNNDGDELLQFFSYNTSFRGGTDVAGGTFTFELEVPEYLVGAGDISLCTNDNDAATAELLGDIEGTVFTAGDNVQNHGTWAEFVNCYNPTWGQYKDRTYPCPGNHDYYTANAAPYFQYFGSRAGEIGEGYYSYDLGNWHIVSLNSNCSHVSCAEGSAQEQWLRNDLANSDKACTLAYMHHPRFSSGLHGNTANVQPLWDALYDYDAEVVINGHDHEYERFAPQTPDGDTDNERGIRAFTVGTGGASLRDFSDIQPNSEVRNNTSYGVIKFSLYSDQYDWEFIPISGDTFTDSGTDYCH